MPITMVLPHRRAGNLPWPHADYWPIIGIVHTTACARSRRGMPDAANLPSSRVRASRPAAAWSQTLVAKSGGEGAGVPGIGSE
jgi:hypothetical protein